MNSEPRSSREEHRQFLNGHRSVPQGLLKAVLVVSRVLRGLIAAAVLCALTGGVPWVLWHYIGWPLPDHVLTWTEMQALLRSPITAELILDIIACACWIWWAMFTFDVLCHAVDLARCGLDNARFAEFTPVSPTNALARALAGAILLAVLGNRLAFASDAARHVTPDTASQVVAAAPARQHPSAEVSQQRTAEPISRSEGPPRARTVTVRAPHNGVHDTMWSIAERALDDGALWTEIFELNRGKAQPHGLTLTQPDLIFPGEELAVPDESSDPTSRTTADPDHLPLPPSTPSSTTPPTPGGLPPSPPQPSPVPTASAPPNTSGNPTAPNELPPPGFPWDTELFVSLGLAAAVSATLIIARHRYRARYRPGSGDRDDLPVAPVIYQLRLAHLRTDHNGTDDDDHVDLERPRRQPSRSPTSTVVLGAQAHANDTVRDGPLALPVGVRQGREIAVALAATHGLGLLGAGAPAAIRALLVTTLTTATPHPPAMVIVPAGDLTMLFGRRIRPASLPAAVRVAPDLDTALDTLESETLVRHGSRQIAGQPWPPVVLATRTPGRQARRLKAIVDNGSQVGVSALLLGQWRDGVTAYVREDGIISATSPGLGEPLRDTHMFRLSDDHVADLLNLLRHAQPDTEPMPAGNADVERQPARGPGRPYCLDKAVSLTVAPPHIDTDRDRTTAGHRVDRGLEILGPTCEPTMPFQHGKPSGRARESQHRDAIPRPSDVPSPDRPALSEQTVPESREKASRLLRIAVLGPPRVWWKEPFEESGGEITEHGLAEREVTSVFQPRLRELLVFLSLHPDGASREALIAALWAASPPERTTNAMNTSMSRLRRAVTEATANAIADVVVIGEGRYRLNSDLVHVDYHHFADAVTARRRATTDNDRIEANRQIVDTYTGPLADGLSTEWIETAREAIRRDAIDAVAALARALIHDDPQQTLDLLEIARAFDPHNELIYRDIMRLQERLGRLDAIPRTLTLLTTRLAEIDDRPTRQTVDLAEQLRNRHDVSIEVDHLDRGQRRAR